MQSLNGTGLHQGLQGLRNRGLPHLPQLHQLSLGLNRSRIHLHPGQQPIPGGFAQQIRLVALPQRQLQILQRFVQAAQITSEHHVEPVHHVEARRQSEHLARLEPPSAPL